MTREAQSNEYSVGAWLDVWLTAVAPRRVRPRTLEGYASIVQRHLVPPLGAILLRDLRPEDVELLLAGLERRGLAPTTQLRIMNVLGRAMTVALQRGYADRNPVRLVDAPTVQRTSGGQALTRDEIRAVLHAVRGRRNSARWAIALGVGLRQCEALALRWSDLDLDSGQLQISRGLHRVQGVGLRFEPPKSERSRRRITLPQRIVDELKEHMVAQERERAEAGDRWADNDLVFAQRTGRPIDRRADHREWVAILEAAKVRRVRLHDARHSVATTLLAHGVSARVVADLLGHSKTSVTLDTYSHVLPAMAAEAARTMQAAVFEEQQDRR